METLKSVELLEAELEKLGCKNVYAYDLARCDMSKAVSDAFKYSS